MIRYFDGKNTELGNWTRAYTNNMYAATSSLKLGLKQVSLPVLANRYNEA